MNKFLRTLGIVALAFGFLSAPALMGPASAVFQSGQKILTGWPTAGEVPIDNGSPIFTVLPQSAGTVTLNGVTPITVANTAVTAGSIVIFTLKTVGGTVSANAPNVLTITPGTGFTVAGSASDTSTYNWIVLG